MQFNNGAGVLAGDTALIWDNTNKRLGVGTATPQAPLHAALGAGVDGDVLVLGQGLTAGQTFAEFNMTQSTGNGKLTLNVGKTGTGYGSIILQGSGGNVGIGTTTPTHSLEINAGATNGLMVSNTNQGPWAIRIRNATATQRGLEILQTDNGYSSLFNSYGTANEGNITFGTTGFVGVGTTAPAAALDVTSTTSGFLAPRMTTAQRDAIASPTIGLQIYNITTKALNVYDGTAWGAVGSGGGGSPVGSFGGMYSTGAGSFQTHVNPYTSGNTCPSGFTAANFAGAGYSDASAAAASYQMYYCYATGGSGGTAAATTGTIQFNSSGLLAGDTSLFWDNTNKRLGIGNSVPTYALDVTGVIRSTGDIYMTKGASPFIGSTDAFDLRLGTALTERMRIMNTGNVGIGTATPAELLHVYGGSGDTKLKIESTTNYAALQIKTNGQTWTLGTDVGLSNAFRLHNGTSNVFAVTPAGNVGIGTTTPTLATLQTVGKVSATAAVFDSGGQGIGIISSWPGIGFNSYYNAGYFAINTGFGGLISLNQTDGSMDFLTAASVTGQGTAQAQTERMRITSAGAVGIGTSAPVATLDVRGSARFDYGRTMTNAAPVQTYASTAGYGVDIMGRTADDAGQLRFINNAYSAIDAVIASDNSGSLQFATNGGTERMRITSSGNVGIGTTAPVEPLHVHLSAGHNVGFFGSTLPSAVGAFNDNFTAWDNLQVGLNLFSMANGNVGIGTTAPAYTLDVAGSGHFTSGPYTEDWFRVNGGGGIYWSTYGGGWNMSDSTWIRSYGGKPMYEDTGFDTGAASGVGCGGALGGGYMFRVCGSAQATGDMYANNYYHNSDRRLKEDIKPSAGLEMVTQMQGVTFTWKKDKTKSAGIIAQDLEKIMPEAVTTKADGFKAVSYDSLFAPIIEAIKQLKALFDNTSAEIAKLKEQIATLTAQHIEDAKAIEELRNEFKAFKAAHP